MKTILGLTLLLPNMGCSKADNAPAQPATQETKAEVVDGIRVGNRALDFEVKDEAGNTVTLSQHKGKQAVLLAFYPKDFTGG